MLRSPRITPRRNALVALAALSALMIALLSGCSHSEHDNHAMHETAVKKNIGYVRAMPPGSTSTAAYLTLENHGSSPFVIASVEADVAGRTEIHTTLEQDGFMQMRRAEDVSIPAHGKLEFKSGGLHVMLMDMEELPKIGDKVSLIFTATDARQIMLELPVHDGKPDNSSNLHRNMHH